MTDLTTPRTQTASERRVARTAGWLMIATFVTSIAGLLLYDPLLNETDYILGGEYDSQVALGALLEVLLIISAVGTAVVLFPVAKRYSEMLALSWVASRIIESAAIMVGIVAVLATLTLRSDLAGADGESLSVAGDTLLAIKDWSFVMGTGFCVAVGNGMILGYLMYRSGLLPRQLAIFGLIGGPLLFVAASLALFDVHEPTDASYFLMAVPEIIWELSFGVYLIAKGFRPSRCLGESELSGRRMTGHMPPVAWSARGRLTPPCLLCMESSTYVRDTDLHVAGAPRPRPTGIRSVRCPQLRCAARDLAPRDRIRGSRSRDLPWF